MKYIRAISLAHIRMPVWVPIWIAILLTMTVWRYQPWMPKVFFGDDLSNYISFLDGNFASTPFQALTAAFAEKYRPVFTIALGQLFKLFGPDIGSYMVINVIIHLFSAVMIFFITLKLSRGSIIVAVLASIIVATSRFALYQVTQITGILEGLGQLIFLIMAYCLVCFEYEESKKTNLRLLLLAFSAIIASLFLVHTHERYVAAPFWIACLFFFTPQFKDISLKVRSLVIIFAILPILVNVLYKSLVLHSAFFVGTGGSHISIDLPGTLSRLRDGLLSIFGFNSGPEYLVGRAIASQPDTFGWQMALVFTVAWAAIIMLAAIGGHKAAINNGKRSLHLPFMLCVLIILLLLPPIMTVRLEQRWLAQPFIILLMLSSWSIGVLENRDRKLGVGLFSVLSVASINVDTYISKSFSNIFFVYSGRTAEIIKRDVVDSGSISATPLVLIAGHDVCNWVLIGGEFFRLYGGSKRTVECIDSMSRLHSKHQEGSETPRIFSFTNAGAASDITNYIREFRDEFQKYNFVELFDKGAINDARHVDTPSGRGALILPWNSQFGLTSSLTVISGFSYRYDGLIIDKNYTLRFDVGMSYKTAEPARAVVKVIESDGSMETIYANILPLQNPKEGVKLFPTSISLEKYYGKTISVMFSVETPGKDQTGHWVAFGAPRIIQMNSGKI